LVCMIKQDVCDSKEVTLCSAAYRNNRKLHLPAQSLEH